MFKKNSLEKCEVEDTEEDITNSLSLPMRKEGLRSKLTMDGLAFSIRDRGHISF